MRGVHERQWGRRGHRRVSGELLHALSTDIASIVVEIPTSSLSTVHYGLKWFLILFEKTKLISQRQITLNTLVPIQSLKLSNIGLS